MQLFLESLIFNFKASITGCNAVRNKTVVLAYVAKPYFATRQVNLSSSKCFLTLIDRSIDFSPAVILRARACAL